jgi:iron-sulfur cluster assembly accessory protein
MPDEKLQDEKNQQDQPLVTLTPAAIEKLKSMMVKDGKEDNGLRVDVVPGGCAGLSYSLRFQRKPYDNDKVFMQGDLQVFINKESLQYLKGTTIDFIDTLKESGFKYKNPNASGSCGCGTSFS